MKLRLIWMFAVVSVMAAGCASTTTKNNGDARGGNESSVTELDFKNPGDKPIRFRDLIDSVRIVLFDESDERSLIGNFNINVYRGDGRYIIAENNSEYPVKFFDDNGKFVNAIRKGQGPGEIDMLAAAYYNVAAKEFVVHNGVSLSIFDNDGNFKSKVDCKLTCDEITCLNGDYLLYAHPFYFSSGLDYGFAVADKDFKIKYQACPYVKGEEYYGLISGPDSKSFRNYGDRVEFLFNDTLFSYDGKILMPKINYKYKKNLDEKGRILTQLTYVSDSRTQIVNVHNMPYEPYEIVCDAESGHYFMVFDEEDEMDFYCYFWTRALEDQSMCMLLCGEDVDEDYDVFSEIIDKLKPEQKPMLKDLKSEDAHWLFVYNFKHF